MTDFRERGVYGDFTSAYFWEFQYYDEKQDKWILWCSIGSWNEAHYDKYYDSFIKSYPTSRRRVVKHELTVTEINESRTN